jgi:hypothetical protein
VSQRLAGCCCESNPCQGPSGSCCFPDGSCRDVACAHYCSQQGGVFRPNVQCSGNPCVPPTQKCNCDDATWRKSNLWIDIVRFYVLTITEITNASVPPDLSLYFRRSTFYYTSYSLTQAQIDAGLLPAIPTDNPTQYPYGRTFTAFPDYDQEVSVTAFEYRITQECCNNVSQTFTVTAPDDLYYDGQGVVDGPYPRSYEQTLSEPAYYCCPGFGYCYDCCCQRIPTACAQVTTC